MNEDSDSSSDEEEDEEVVLAEVKKQLDVKDEDLVDSVAVDRAEIDKIDNNIKNKQTIRDAIKAGANCVKRGT